MSKLHYRPSGILQENCVNRAMVFNKRRKTSRMTRIVLLVSFIILAGRLLYVLPGAIEHHKQKKQETPVSVSTVK
ncbi:YfgG family protein [Kalamiella sp. sgz302252]|uniref:YfgG family protein n=1 Tax=Pantoea sp. sgz302252 TaxID=3341827 RepID=UPI0036D2DB84